jgi:hypothetical protein
LGQGPELPFPFLFSSTAQAGCDMLRDDLLIGGIQVALNIAGDTLLYLFAIESGKHRL